MRVTGLPQRGVGNAEPLLPCIEQNLEATDHVPARRPVNFGHAMVSQTGQPFTDIPNDPDGGAVEHARRVVIGIPHGGRPTRRRAAGQVVGTFGQVSSDLSRAAGACPVVVAAVRLAEWVGEVGVPVTPGGSLRPADVPAAASALGMFTRAKVRRAADNPEVHRPWPPAVTAGLIAIAGNRAVRAGQLDDPLAAWWAGLQALLAAEAADTIGVDPRITALVTMDVVTSEHVDEGWGLQRRVGHV